MSSDLQAVGQLVREHLPVAVSDSQHLRARARLLEASRGRQPALATWRWPALSLAATAAALLIWLSQKEGAPLTAMVDGRAISHQETRDIEAQRALLFSDGSSVELRTPGSLRLTATTQRGADIELVSGRALVSVTPKPQAHWRVSAGPYIVHVVGTRFELGWDEKQGQLRLAMSEGKVRVVGPQLGEGQWLGQGDQFEASVPGWRSRRAPFADAPSSDAPSAPPPKAPSPDAAPARGFDSHALREPQGSTQEAATPTPADVDRSASSTPKTALRTRPAKPKPPTWSFSAQVAQGQYAQALSTAEALGIPRVLDGAPVQELMALADAARFSGRPALARQALGTVRTRFGGSPSSAAAAFMLGRLAQNADPVLALDWYDTYLREAPDGPLAQEAMGRRLLLLRRLGTPSAQRRAADEYLRRYPDGPHAHHARALAADD